MSFNALVSSPEWRGRFVPSSSTVNEAALDLSKHICNQQRAEGLSSESAHEKDAHASG
jgi:hypothetical protein